MASTSSSAVAPKDVANCCFERIKHLDLTDLNFREEIRTQMEMMSVCIHPDAKNQFVKSSANQLQVLVKQFVGNPLHFDLNGEWLGRKAHQNQILTDFEEATLCGILVSQRQLGKKISPSRIKQAAQLAYGGDGRQFSKNWVKRFSQRNDDIFYLQRKRSMSAGRTSELTFDQCELFCEAFSDLLEVMEKKKFPVHPDTLCNMDETLLRIARNGRLELELIPREERTGTRAASDSTVIGSMLVFVTATGTVPYIYFCMKKEKRARKYPVPNMKFNREGKSGNKTSIYEVGDTWSETGYMSEHHIHVAIANFASVMKHFWGSSHPIILLADNLRQHQTLSTLKLSATNGIQLQFLTPNASHFLQPLDDKLFAIFKKELERTYDQLEGSLSALGLEGRNVLASVIRLAFDCAFTPLHIRESWYNVGIWPFSPHLIMERALKYTGKAAAKKYTQHISVPFKELAFTTAMEMNTKARETVLEGMSGSFERATGIRKRPSKPKKNCATELFQATRGNHDLLLKHEQEKKEEEEKRASRQEEKKKTQETRKRKREEELEAKKNQKEEIEKKREREMQSFRERTCQVQPCKFVFDDTFVRAKFWRSCPCGKFYVCPSHKDGDQGIQKVSKHLHECQASTSKQ